MINKNEILRPVVTDLMSQGFRVFIAQEGPYKNAAGFYTDAKGEHLVTFDAHFGQLGFRGHVIRENGDSGCMTWQIKQGKYQDMLAIKPPKWVTGNTPCRQTRVEDMLALATDSHYTEITASTLPD